MKKLKKILNEIFIDGLGGMATGLFATLIIGTIISTAGGYVVKLGNPTVSLIGQYIVLMGKTAMILTGAGIGCGVACKFKEKPLVVLSASVAGMIGGYAPKIIDSLADPSACIGFLSEGGIKLSGYGEPLGAFIAALVAIYIGRLIAGKTKVDILLTPLCCILAGGTVGLLVGPPISKFMVWVGSLINYGTLQAPILMGIIVSVLMGIALTLPISSAAIGVILSLSGIAAGAATAGCCANMIGFAIASFKDNKWNGLFAQGIGTSMLQMPNIVKKPIIWVPAIVASAITGPLATTIFNFENNASGSGMGTAGLVGPINAYQVMVENGQSPVWVLVKIALVCFILPGIIAWGTAWGMRKLNLIKDGDMKLDK